VSRLKVISTTSSPKKARIKSSREPKNGLSLSVTISRTFFVSAANCQFASSTVLASKAESFPHHTVASGTGAYGALTSIVHTTGPERALRSGTFPILPAGRGDTSSLHLAARNQHAMHSAIADRNPLSSAPPRRARRSLPLSPAKRPQANAACR
jgi:hypothetical protein